MHYNYPLATTFPDRQYLEKLVQKLEVSFKQSHNTLEQLLTYSSAQLNWIADFVLDESIQWRQQEIAVHDLYLGGTTPEWNQVIIDQCQRSPQKLKEKFASDPQLLTVFEKAQWSEDPILVRLEDGKYKVFDGMHRTIAAIRDGKDTMQAFIALMPESFRPVCEPHVVYDLLRAYLRKVTNDRAGLVSTLRYLRHCYVNVEHLLKYRFDASGIPHHEEIQAIIKESLQDISSSG